MRLIDRAARAAAGGHTRRDVARMAAGAAAVAVLPAGAWPAAAPAAKTRGLCTTRPRGTCPSGLTPGRWKPGTTGAIDSGVPSRFNGCGPESGVKLPAFGRTDPVPDRPLLLANFFGGCRNHDCCYGTCGSDKGACDRAFLAESLQACADARHADDAVGIARRLNCNLVAHIYFKAVSGDTGVEAWTSAQETACLSCETCAADLLTDRENCGTCGVPCAPGLGCCVGHCTDFLVDPANCGACGNRCREDQRCIGGQCLGCRKPEITCGTQCCNPKTHTCEKGACRRKCPRREAPCGDVCCALGEVCQDGACRRPDDDRSLCDGTPCPSDRECCFRTEASPDRGVCCPAGTTCYGHSSGFASCKPV